MGKPVMFKTPAGEEMVILARADYDALVAGLHNDEEDAADVASFDTAMARLDSGEDRRLSSEEMAEFSMRPGFLRGLRKARGLTQAAVAASVGMGQSHLSDIECGRKAASRETRSKLLAFLTHSAELS
jgi:DNA-binding transcriptional regulator YiaG